jgi:hypothetical protein
MVNKKTMMSLKCNGMHLLKLNNSQMHWAQGHPNMPADHKTVIHDEGQGEGKKKAWTKKENTKAWAYYTLAFKYVRFRGMINEAKTDEWPGG